METLTRKPWTAQTFPPRPIVDGFGNVTVVRPLDLRAEIDAILREERDRAECARLCVPSIAGAASGSWTFTHGARTHRVGRCDRRLPGRERRSVCVRNCG